jgi:hypothetical protein
MRLSAALILAVLITMKTVSNGYSILDIKSREARWIMRQTMFDPPMDPEGSFSFREGSERFPNLLSRLTLKSSIICRLVKLLTSSCWFSVCRVCVVDRFVVRNVGMEYRPHLRLLFAFSFASLRSEAILYIVGVFMSGDFDRTKLYSEQPTT